MRNLGRALLRLFGRDDRGAIAVLVAVLIGGGVLLGMAAMVIDVGQIYQNRAELQNGADAAALAIATQCADGTCPANPVSTATTYASANASALTQGTAGVDCVRGSDGLSDPSCPSNVASGSGLTNCPSDPPAGTHFVDVQTETRLPSGSTLLPPVFGRTVIGSATYDGTTVKACAQAEWGPPQGLAFTISSCQLNIATDGGTRYWDLSNGWPDSSYDTQFLIHDPTSKLKNTDCPTGPANQNAPGAFGWTAGPGNGPNTNCVTYVTSTGTYTANTGSSAKDCKSELETVWQNRTPVLVPVYVEGSVTGSGNNTTYTLATFAPFIVTGFYVPSSSNSAYSAPDWLNPPLLSACTGQTTCIDGFFLTPSNHYPAADNVKLTG